MNLSSERAFNERQIQPRTAKQQKTASEKRSSFARLTSMSCALLLDAEAVHSREPHLVASHALIPPLRMWLLLSPFWSVAAAGLVSASFVLSLYVWRHPLTIDRDLPSVIRQRITSTMTVAMLSIPLLWVLQWTPPAPTLPDGAAASPFAPGPPLTEWIGFPARPASEYLIAIILPTCLTASLFIGPMVVSCIMACRTDPNEVGADNLQAFTSSLTAFFTHLWSPSERWKSIRNLIAAPIAEEIVFRGAVLALLVAGGFSFGICVLLSPVLFGLAHLHHLINLVKARGLSLANGAVVVTFQLAYTTLFGAYAAFVYLRTGHMVAAIAAHTFCNMMGFPELTFLSRAHYLHPRRFALLAVFLAGIVIFSLSLWPLTDERWYTSSQGEGPWLRRYQTMLAEGGGMYSYMQKLS
jgi:prenyl protein peptidase